jgi:ABC-type multidrug transport system fused ATPase/permease subunit
MVCYSNATSNNLTNIMKQEKEEKVSRSAWSILREYLQPFRTQLFFLSAIGLVSAIANGFCAVCNWPFFDALIGVANGEVSETGLPLWLTLLAAWALIQFIATQSDWVVDRFRGHLDLRLHMSAQVKGFEHLLLLPMSYHASARTNENLEMIGRAGWRLEGIVNTFVTMVPQFLSVIIGITLAASINGLLASALACGVLLYVLVLIWMLRPIAKRDAIAHKEWGRVSMMLQPCSFKLKVSNRQQLKSMRLSAFEKHSTRKLFRSGKHSRTPGATFRFFNALSFSEHKCWCSSCLLK